MSFDKVIGYAQTKKALLPLLQMLQGDKRYNEMGAVLPHGVILCGEPNVGKTLFAKTLIEESGWHCVEAEADKLTEVFSQAAQEKTILFLDNVAQDRFPVILKEMDSRRMLLCSSLLPHPKIQSSRRKYYDRVTSPLP